MSHDKKSQISDNFDHLIKSHSCFNKVRYNNLNLLSTFRVKILRPERVNKLS